MMDNEELRLENEESENISAVEQADPKVEIGAEVSTQPIPVYIPAEKVAPEKLAKKKKGWTFIKVLAVALCCSIIAGITGAGSVLIYEKVSDRIVGGKTTIYKSDREPVEVEIVEVESGKLLTPAQIYAANVNATVGIRTSVTTNYWGYQTTGAVAGSGFILTPDGYIATNYHVVEGASSITVTAYNGASYEAMLVGYDPDLDFAVLKVDAKNLQPVVIGNSDTINVGDQIMAIGNPLGELTFSLSEGIVSALNRKITFADGASNAFIQTDCAINPGNSGGAMFNSYGEVVGIATAKYSGSTSDGGTIDNIGFAIPINHILQIVEDVLEKGGATKAYLGVTVTDVNKQFLNFGVPAGAAIYSVEEGGAAEAAGLKSNDIVTAVDDIVIESRDDLTRALAQYRPGDKVVLTVFRSGQTMTLEATLGEAIVVIEY